MKAIAGAFCVQTLQTCATGCDFAVDIYAQRVDGKLALSVRHLIRRCRTRHIIHMHPAYTCQTVRHVVSLTVLAEIF